MEFWASLIIISGKQTKAAMDAIRRNCNYVDNDCWIYEGDIEALEHYGVKFRVLSEGAIPSIGGLTKKELLDICDECFGIDVYKQSFA